MVTQHDDQRCAGRRDRPGDDDDEGGEQGDPDRHGDPAEGHRTPILAAGGPSSPVGAGPGWVDGQGSTPPKRRTRRWNSITAS